MSKAEWKVTGVMPTVTVGDLDEAVAYYRALGFLEEWAHPSGDSPSHVGLSLGSVDLMLAVCVDPAETIQRQNLYILVDGIAAYHAFVRQNLGESIPDLVDADYGMRDFTIRDPWGHLLTFGEGA
ncbi:MAG: hypothetical protein R3244_12655 [Thermoanaerobaculia bacterium]|nr:hypothetical protein [Thermoanaerobaculia bacterium]